MGSSFRNVRGRVRVRDQWQGYQSQRDWFYRYESQRDWFYQGAGNQAERS